MEDDKTEDSKTGHGGPWGKGGKNTQWSREGDDTGMVVDTGEVGNRWDFQLYDSEKLWLSMWIAHQRVNFLQIFWGFPISSCVAIILLRALLNEIWEIF